jgi:hypothetical protein
VLLLLVGLLAGGFLWQRFSAKTGERQFETLVA